MGHWSLLLLPPLLAYRSPTFFAFGGSLDLNYLLVPLAALLAKRFGLTGVISIAIGGLVFVIGVGSSGWGSLGGYPALYLVALAVAAIVASPRPLSEWLLWPGSARAANWLAFAAPFLLVTGFVLGGDRPSGGGLRLAFSFHFSLLGYFLLFLMGARGVPIALAVAGLAGAAAATWALALGGWLPKPEGDLYLRVGVLQPVTALAGLVAFAAGAAMTAVLQDRPLHRLWRRPYWAIAALLVLWFGPDAISAIQVKLPGVRAIYLLQASIVLPFAAFMAGLLRGARGAFFVSAGAVVYMVLWIAAAFVAYEIAELRLRIYYLPFEAPFVAVAFAVLGAKVAEMRRTPDSFAVLRIPAFILLVIGTGLAIVGEGGTARYVLGGVFLAGSCAIFIAAIRLRRAMAGTAFEITAERWMGFTTILFIALSMLANLEAAGGALKQGATLLLPLRMLWDESAAEQWRDHFGSKFDAEDLAVYGVMLVLYVGGLYAVGRALWRAVPKVYDDARRIVGFIREWRARVRGSMEMESK